MTEKTKRTPGPWKVEGGGEWVTGEDPGNGGDIICNCPDPAEERLSFKHWPANAKLIAAAPDLLDVCEAIVTAFKGNHFPTLTQKHVLDGAKAAIAKALR